VALGAVLIFAGLLVYFPALRGTWVWDDASLIRDNPLMADAGGFWKFWFAPPGPDFFPLTSSVEWSLWRIFGDHPLPFHLLSLALHLLSAFLIWRLFSRLGVRRAWLGALLFVVHPLAVESVAWISELKNTLSLPLLLGSLLCWLNYDERARPAHYSAALVLFLAALLAKTSVVMLPVVLLLYAWWRHGRITRAKLLSIAPFFAVALVLGVLTLIFQNQMAIGVAPIDAGGPLARMAGAGWAMAFYLGKFFWPVNLLPTYPPWKFDSVSPTQFFPWVALVMVLVILWQRRRTDCGRAMLLGLGFFLLNLAPVIGFVTMSYMRIAWVADHFAYLPMIGLIGLVVAACDKLCAWPSRYLLPLFTVASALLVCALGGQASSYAANFHDPITLWSYTLWQYPGSWGAELNLGQSLAEAGQLPAAVVHLARAVEITEAENLETQSFGPHLALANTLAQLNRLDESIPHFQIAARLRPDSLEAHVNYGDVLLRQGDIPGAGTQYAEAVYFHPEFAGAHFNYANVLLRENRPRDAIIQYQAVLMIDPDFGAARIILGKLHVPAAPSAAQ
jgi:tetratricopeptide (TPR) repeat protein